MNKTSSRVISEKTISFYVPLLYATIALAFTSIAEQIIVTTETVFRGTWLARITFIIWTITLVYCFYTLIRGILLLRKEQSLLASLCTSAFLSALLLNLLGIAFTIYMTYNLWVSISSILLTIVLLPGLSILITLVFSQVPGNEEQNSSKTLTETHPDTSSLVPYVSSVQGEVFKKSNPVIPDKLPVLPPLFLQDGLHQMPESTQTMQFFAVTKTNEALVFSDDACVAKFIAPRTVLIALCDGASNSNIPRPWASLLGHKWLKEPFPEVLTSKSLTRWLEEPRRQWEEWVKNTWWSTVNERNALTHDAYVSREELAEILHEGADATFLGIHIDRQSKQWEAVTIGDTCMFHLKQVMTQQWQLISWPLKKSTDFHQNPPLLTTRSDALEHVLPYIQRQKKSYQRGDVLMLATDALAQWILLEIEQNQIEWKHLASLKNSEEFTKLVNLQRERGLMQEDDTTLVIIRL